jgi:uncharacterized protein (DUF1501 family)
MNRRQFMRRSAVTAVGLGFSSPLLRSVASAAPGARAAAGADKVVVAVNLFGGNDGLNTVVPLAQYDTYRRYRPKLAIPREQLVALPDAPDYALNPAMSPLAPLYVARKVAVIPGVGVPPDSSGLFDHNASQGVFQTGDVTSSSARIPTGWLGRWLDSVDAGLVSPGVDFGGGGLVLDGSAREALTIGSIEQFRVQPSNDAEARMAAYESIMAVSSAGGAVAERNRTLRVEALAQSAVVRERTENYVAGAEYPDLEGNYLSYALLQSAKLITADLGVRALAVGYDGFDTHAGQNGRGPGQELGYHDRRLNDVAGAIAAFHQDLAAHGAADRVTTVVYSEFGRRPYENNDQGTDHGYGSVGLVIGGSVRGGVYGGYPSLEEDHLVLDGNVDVTTDFRSVYATILGGFLGADPGPVLGGDFPTLGFF